MADQAYAVMDVDGVITHLSAAVRSFSETGDCKGAALASARLGSVMGDLLVNRAAATAWFRRARRLIGDEPPCVEQGWVALAGMGCEVSDPAELLASAELALDRARRFGDVALETKALADGGLAHVQLWHIDIGMAMLDEAMALVCGPVAEDPNVPGAVCSFFTACYHAADFARADAWAASLRRHGLIGPTPGAPLFLSSHCDAVHATLLVELGRWHDAEQVLTVARDDFIRAMPMAAWHPEIALADLRVRQGRYADAEELLLGKDQYVQALLPAARLALARGDVELAVAAARRGLRSLGDDRLRAVELLTVLVEAELARGDVDAADRACTELARRIDGVAVPTLAARAACARARVLTATDRHDAAIALLDDALADLGDGLPYVRSATLLCLARVRRDTGDRAGSALDAQDAADTLTSLDVEISAADVDLLADLLGRPGRRRTATLACTDGKWVAASDGVSVRLADTKGLRYLAILLAEPGRERHVLDLVDRVEGVERGIDRRQLGDAGPTLDNTARAEYRRRIEELRMDVEEAIERGDDDTAAQLDEELQRLVTELAQRVRTRWTRTTCIVDHRARPPQRHESTPHRDLPTRRGVPRRGRARSERPHRHLLRVHPDGRRRGMDRSPMTERSGPE